MGKIFPILVTLLTALLKPYNYFATKSIRLELKVDFRGQRE
jgi:hypothetical protein